MEIINQKYYDRYVKFMSIIPNRKYIQFSGLERHHVTPVSIDKSLKYNKNNIKVLTCREHYIAHWMLEKLMQHSRKV